jgi:hypothetical protein
MLIDLVKVITPRFVSVWFFLGLELDPLYNKKNIKFKIKKYKY